MCSGFRLTTAGLAANKPHCAAILSVDGEFLYLLTRIFLIVTRRGVMKKQRVRKRERNKERKIMKERGKVEGRVIV